MTRLLLAAAIVLAGAAAAQTQRGDAPPEALALAEIETTALPPATY